MKKTIKKMIDVMEYNSEPAKTCEHCKHQTEERGWYSFTHEAIKSETPEYNILSDIIHDHSWIDEDSRYKWIYNALNFFYDSVKEEKEDDDVLRIIENIEINEVVDSEVSFYFSEQAEWLSKGNNHTYLTEALNNGAGGDNVMAAAQYNAVYEIYTAVREAIIDLSKAE